MPLRYKTISSPVGELTLLASDSGICGVLWNPHHNSTLAKEEREHAPSNPLLLKAEQQLAEYFAGERTRFELPLDMRGTDFQCKVWRELAQIPHGETRSYLDIAMKLGDKNATRAVGAANGRNPISIIVPCHRVIGANGSLTGFGGGIENKRWLLAHEKKHERLFA